MLERLPWPGSGQQPSRAQHEANGRCRKERILSFGIALTAQRSYFTFPKNIKYNIAAISLQCTVFTYSRSLQACSAVTPLAHQ